MKSDKNSPIAIVMGSKSDMDIMIHCINQLNAFDIHPIIRILSAHRTPMETAAFTESASDNNFKVIIAAAGMAAHLAGAIASRTILPIIGVPINCNTGIGGLDALLSTVQMPPGIPVATVGLGKAGAKNAALLALQILALTDNDIKQKLTQFRKYQRDQVLNADTEIQD